MEPLCLWILNNKLNSFATFPTTMMSQRHVCMHRHSLLFKRVQRCGGAFTLQTHTHQARTHIHTHTVHINSQNTIYSSALLCLHLHVVCAFARGCCRLLDWTVADNTCTRPVCPASLSTFQLHLRQRDMHTKVDLDLGRAHSFSSPID